MHEPLADAGGLVTGTGVAGGAVGAEVGALQAAWPEGEAAHVLSMHSAGIIKAAEPATLEASLVPAAPAAADAVAVPANGLGA